MDKKDVLAPQAAACTPASILFIWKQKVRIILSFYHVSYVSRVILHYNCANNLHYIIVFSVNLRKENKDQN